MASFFPNMVQKYVDLHAQPIPDYPQPLRVNMIWLKWPVFLGKNFGCFTAVGNFAPAVGIIGAYFCWPYIQHRVKLARAAAQVE